MNYLAHGLASLDDPYQTAGAAVPDWLGLTRPRLRCRSRHARPFIELPDATTAAIARGVARHHAEDDWFHQTPAFGDVSLELARRVRHATDDAETVRPGFLGHILLELLLDASLMTQDPACVDRYYAALAHVDAHVVARAVGEMTGADASPLASIIERFSSMRFLYDYLEDGLLVFRLNQVMHRVGLAALPTGFASMLPASRRLVSDRVDELLTPPASKSPSEALLATLAG